MRPTCCKLVQAFSREHQVFDMNAVAKECGTVVSAVLLGAIAGSGVFPFERRCYEEAVCGGVAPEQAGGMAKASLRGFAKAFDIVSQQQQQAVYLAQVMGADALDSRLRGNDKASPVIPGADALDSRLRGNDRASPVIPAEAGIQGFPEPVMEMAALGYARLVEYQDRAYAEQYADRLRQVLAAEREADPAGAHGFAITREMARWLALWMAFDDIVRVADLKSRASRRLRVQGEVKAADGDLLKVYDHFKPGVPEFAALLPPALAKRLVALGPPPHRRRPRAVGAAAEGRHAHRLRHAGAAHAGQPQGPAHARQPLRLRAAHDRPLAGRRAARHAPRLDAGPRDRAVRPPDQGLWRHQRARQGDAAARAGAPGRLCRTRQAAAGAIAEARSAALADDAGTALDATLVRHGAPPREIKPQPIRFVRRKPASQRPT